MSVPDLKERGRKHMSENIAILFSGYMAGVVFGSIMSVTLYKIILNKNGILRQAGQPSHMPSEGQVSQ
jgi:hypothetical protein